MGIGRVRTKTPERAQNPPMILPAIKYDQMLSNKALVGVIWIQIRCHHDKTAV